MDTNPAFHPQSLEDISDRAPDSPRGEDVPEIGAWPESVPCTPEFDPLERRAYGGVFASKLAAIADRLTTFRLTDGLGLGKCLDGFFKLGKKMRHALYIYTRVKDAMVVLYEPEEIDLPINRHGDYLQPEPRPVRPKFTWDVSPQESYENESICFEKGQDIRGSSLYWVEQRARQVKSRARKAAREAYIKDHGLVAARREPVAPKKALNATPVKKTFTPRPLIMGEIWPPVPIPSKVDAGITVKPVVHPLVDKGIAAMGRKLGIDFYYYEYYQYTESIANMWSGEEGDMRRGRGPP